MNFLKKVDKAVFYPAAVICILFIAWMALVPESAGQTLNNALNFINSNFAWLYILSISAFVIVCLVIAFSKYGNIRLGKDDDRPEYSTFTWFAMLFSAAMGIGVIFWGVAEPISFFSNPPVGEAYTKEAGQWALRQTVFHWGIHPWSVYALVGMALAYVGFRKGLPGRISSIFVPILGEDNLNGKWAKVIDIFAVLASIAGIAVSLGLGSMQINGGLSFLYGIEVNDFMTGIIIVVLTIIFCGSAAVGIEKGMARVSNTNVALMIILMSFFLIFGPTKYILESIATVLGDYLQNIIWLSGYADPNGIYQEKVGFNWIGAWTVFYWAWWISWGPFVGGFVAKVSKGRTIREFILGALIVPTLVCAVWMVLFGGTAIHMELYGQGGIAEAVAANIDSALFVTLGNLPIPMISGIVAVFLIGTFFITSADSATFTVAMYSSGGDMNPDARVKVFWGVIEGLITIALLVAGGLQALKAASVLTAFPFMLIILGIIYCMFKLLKQEFVSGEESQTISSKNKTARI